MNDQRLIAECPKCRTTNFMNCHSMHCPMRSDDKTPDQPGYRYAQLEKEPTPADAIAYFKNGPAARIVAPSVPVEKEKPDFEEAANEYSSDDKNLSFLKRMNAANSFKAGASHGWGKAQESKWIDVKERLPEDRMLQVLVFNGDAPEYNQHVFHATWFRERANFKSMQEGYKYMGQITHWMPLPEPPKQIG